MPDGPEHLRIEPAPLALKEQIKELTRATFEEHRARQPHAFAQNGFELMVNPVLEQAFHRTATLPDCPAIFAAFKGDTLAGYVVLSEWLPPGQPQAPYVSIDDIRVLPEFRGQGIGKALVDHIKDLAQAHDWDNLRATVWTGNTASAALFDSAGFSMERTTYRIGPNRQARYIPVDKAPKSSFVDKAVAVLALLDLGYLLSLVSRVL